MGTGEKLAGLVTLALLSIAGIIAAVYNGQPPNWGPLGDLFIELAFGTGSAAAAAFFIVQWVKRHFPSFAGTPLFIFHLAMAVGSAVLAYIFLVLLNLTEVTERGAIMVAGVAFTNGKIVWEQYKNSSPAEVQRQVERAKDLLADAGYTVGTNEFATRGGPHA